MIRNPYAKATGLKRPRPDDTTTANIKTSPQPATTAGVESHNSSINNSNTSSNSNTYSVVPNHKENFVNPYRTHNSHRPSTSYIVPRLSPTRQVINTYRPRKDITSSIQCPNSDTQISPPDNSNNTKPASVCDNIGEQEGRANCDDSFDDGGLDWNLALQQLDAVVAISSSQNATIGNNYTKQTHDTAPILKVDGKAANTISNSSQPAHQASLCAKLRPDTWLDQSKQTSNTAPATTASMPKVIAAPEPQQEGLPKSMQYSPETVQPVIDEHTLLLEEFADLDVPLANGWTLFPHQKNAILKGLSMRRLVLALDMGLGKTLIGCVWAKSFYCTCDTKIIVICPVTLKKEWYRTATEATSLSVQDEKSDGPDTTKDVFICSWAKVPTSLPSSCSYVVVADEAHSMQSMNAARTKDALMLMQAKNCKGVLLLTGTPMKNGKPSNLFPLLKAVKHPLGKNQKAYEKHFCGGKEISFGRGRVAWAATGSSNLDQLHKLVSTHVLYLTKEQCLDDIPTQTRIFKDVPVSSRRLIQHQNALHELAKAYQRGLASSDQKDAVLGAVQKVRMVGSLAKVEATVEIAKATLLNEPSIVIFTSFLQVAKQVHQQLVEAGWTGELLTGETQSSKRQDLVDNFQSGLSSVFVCTYGAGGVGLTLTAASTVILLDRPWTPGEVVQAEDRIRRIGQDKPVTSIWIRAFDLDRQIDSMLDQKSKTSTAVLAGGGDGNGNGRSSNAVTEAPRISIFQMLKSILKTTKEVNTDSTGTMETTVACEKSEGQNTTRLVQLSS